MKFEVHAEGPDILPENPKEGDIGRKDNEMVWFHEQQWKVVKPGEVHVFRVTGNARTIRMEIVESEGMRGVIGSAVLEDDPDPQ
jgi:hypothetical protein